MSGGLSFGNKLKQIFILVSIPALLLALNFFLTATAAFAADPPAILTYQGKLLVNSASVTTTQNMGFVIYDSLTGGNTVYTAGGTLASTSTISVTPVDGIFSVNLGDTGTNIIPTSTFRDYSNLYLEVSVGGQVLSPRKRITSVGYAINAEYLMGITPTTTSGTTYIPISDRFGNFNFTGNSQSNTVLGGLVVINPSSTPSINSTLLGLAVNGSEKFRIDASGNVFTAGLTTQSGGFISNASSSIASTLSVTGATTISSTLSIQSLTTLTGGFITQSSSTVNAPLTVASHLPIFF
jgi:hypothetical protein